VYKAGLAGVGLAVGLTLGGGESEGGVWLSTEAPCPLSSIAGTL
jgi:hypothetical protein